MVLFQKGYDKNSIWTIVSIAVVVIVISLLVWYGCYKKSVVNIETYTDYPTSYATLETIYSRPLFEPDPIRRCADGAYMYSSNPWLGVYCSSIPPEMTAAVGCSRAFSGKPVKLAYTMLSDNCCPKPDCYRPLSATCCPQEIDVSYGCNSCCC